MCKKNRIKGAKKSHGAVEISFGENNDTFKKKKDRVKDNDTQSTDEDKAVFLNICIICCDHCKYIVLMKNGFNAQYAAIGHIISAHHFFLIVFGQT